jgi:BolA protein
MKPEERVAALHAALDAALAPTFLEVIDESHRHAGHAGARDGRGHFRVRLESARFVGMAPLARHRAVYAALADLMTTDIHALAVDARAPGDSAY